MHSSLHTAPIHSCDPVGSDAQCGRAGEWYLYPVLHMIHSFMEPAEFVPPTHKRFWMWEIIPAYVCQKKISSQKQKSIKFFCGTLYV